MQDTTPSVKEAEGLCRLLPKLDLMKPLVFSAPPVCTPLVDLANMTEGAEEGGAKVVEYSEISQEAAQEIDPSTGALRLNAGNICE